MKQNIKLLFAAGLIGLATSCTDLDVPVKSQYTKYPSSEVAQEAQMADVYYHLRGTLGRRYSEAQALASDEYVGISFGGDYFDSGTYAHTCLHNFNYTDPSIGWYADVASGITKANRVIVNMGGDDADPKAIAPARAMRAFYHFILMDSYGDVPILDAIPDEDEAVERKPRAEVARFIESELLDIIPYLSETNDETTYGKPNKWMAEALLVKLYINWSVYTAASVDQYDAATAQNEKLNDCVKYCDEIIKSGKFSISEGATGYRSKFFPTPNNDGYKIKDFIYAMPYHTTQAQGMQYGRPRTWRQAKGNYNSYYGMQLSNSCGGNFSMTPEMSDLFTLPHDDRNDNILAGQIFMYDPTTYAKTTTPFTYKGEPVVLSKEIELDPAKEDKTALDVGKNLHGWCQGYKSVKWFVIDEDYREKNRNQSNDIPIFRYADILLTKAEAIVRGATPTNNETAESLFNQIRTYVHASDLGHTPSLKDIYDERGRELFDENWRRNDMIRFGHFEDEYGFHKRDFPTANFDKRCRVFPIPKSVLEQNTNWNQNAGYDGQN